ncbi:FAD-dependent oxidoreductase [Nonomuraea endophytica]|uniref:2-polyprenyl-6-methoxyphenol hydroxylase-like FAD-dependent oxidoreductase n=1 Tax=Nonomuraea endophytica TaxID=714136 RepID=A0A7W8EK34_9ACTN|nr:NAD(P)/FAD-dependent oxidoreductase [Nonomuraea endophytica]MBB5082299.1 2-polyprenyl-6-methoxyphenol hydroxylase-like FAD-dependent oxidoreductase [Nonomuraea endophytica]
MTFHVAVIGAGVGGLCLAQGLHKAGVDVTVYERDRTPTNRLQGYRLHINPLGAQALRECMSPELWQAFLATTGKGGLDFVFMTERLRPLIKLEAGERDANWRDHHSVSRITLRQILLTGLHEVVRFDRTFERYERRGDGRITLHFADGSTATTDVLVAADGSGSRVRQQYLPQAERIDTGITRVAGKFPLTEETKRLIPAHLYEGLTNIVPARGYSMFCAPHDFGGDPVVLPGGIGASEREGAMHDNTSSYILWAFGAETRQFPADAAEMPGAAIRDLVTGMIGNWHPDLLRMIDMTPPETVSLLPIRSAVPTGPWAATNVTLLGDAIHTMAPHLGLGANTALRDARLLCQELTAAQAKDVVAAIAAYESQMTVYGFAAVRDSLNTARRFVTRSPLARLGFRTFLRTAQRIPMLKERAFAAGAA